MNAKITITKVDDNNFNVNFSQAMTGPGNVNPGDEVPLEWMRAVLDYYVNHGESDGTVPPEKIQKIIGFW